MEYQSDRALLEASAFVTVARAGGFTAAARSAGVRKATLTERVRALEERLDVSLLARTTRVVRLTEEGRAYLEHAERALSAFQAAEAAATSFGKAPAGTLRVTVPPPLASALLTDVVPQYLARCPAVSIVVDSSIENVDLARRDFDVAVRMGPLHDSALVCRRLAARAGGYYVSPSYRARRGVPKTPDELAAHDVIGITRTNELPTWHFVKGGRPLRVTVKPRVFVSTFEQGIAAAVAGLGVVPAGRFAVRSELAARRLVPVLQAWTPAAFDVYVVYPNAGVAPKTRVFVDMLSAWFSRHPT